MTEEQFKKLDAILTANDEEAITLTGWEGEFIDDLMEKEQAWAGAYTLSAKQAESLDRIYAKHILRQRDESPAAKRPIKAIAGMAAMPVVVVYRSPKDYPGKWVARRFEIKPDGTAAPHTAPVAVRDNYEKLREAVKANLPGSTRVPRDPKDDPVIVEVWL